jgi:hypothetical protein
MSIGFSWHLGMRFIEGDFFTHEGWNVHHKKTNGFTSG